MDIAALAFFPGVIAYSAAATLFFMDLARRETLARGLLWGPRLLGIGAAFHALHIVTASLVTHTCPVESLNFSLSLAGLAANLVYLAIRGRANLHAMGAFVAPLALTFLVSAQFVKPVQHTSEVSRVMLTLHITASLLGVGCFLLAGAAGSFYLIQERRLKEKRVHLAGSRLPPLDALDTTEHRLLLAGFPLLTFGVVTGALFISELGTMSPAGLIRALLGYTAWFLVAGVLVLRATAGWRGRRTAYGTLGGVLCVVAVLILYAVQSGGAG